MARRPTLDIRSAAIGLAEQVAIRSDLSILPPARVFAFASACEVRCGAMIHELRISNFRAFRSFRAHGLRRVNLLVGTNNCGKTSVLEAISILTSTGAPGAVWSILSRRGEVREEADEREVELAHLFNGHQFEASSRFNIVGEYEHSNTDMTGLVRPRESQDRFPARRSAPSARQRELFVSDDDETSAVGPLALQLSWDATGQARREVVLPITRAGGLTSDVLAMEGRRPSNDELVPVLFLPTDGLNRDRVVALYEQTVLTSDEDMVVNSLRTIEPGIERIATVGTLRRYASAPRGGLVLRVDGQRVPVGSMGDGIWRLLGVALALVRCRGGVLLIDEIDTGLHYSVLEHMWKLVLETAARLDVQVFATTHSRDCYEALAAASTHVSEQVSLQRIERGLPEAVAFDREQLQRAAERGIEVR